MFHSEAAIEGITTELAFSKVLNYRPIGTFQKWPFWRQNFVFLLGVIGSFEDEICTFRYAPQLKGQ